MAAEKTLSVKSLAELGATRLAELLLEIVEDDASAKRRLRLELTSRAGGDKVAAEIRKRLATIAKSRSFVEWQKMRAFSQDLDLQRAAIMDYVAPTAPNEAFELLWRFLEMAPALYDRCDDSNGTVSGIIAEARDNLGDVAASSSFKPVALADRVFDAVCSNDYGQYDGLIALLAPSLAAGGLAHLKARFEAMAAQPPTPAPTEQRRVIGISSKGPIYEDDWQPQRHARLVKAALAEIADAQGDVDAYRASFTAQEQANPHIATGIAQRLLAAGRAQEAMDALGLAVGTSERGTRWGEWEECRITTLEALGDAQAAQAERWALFARDLRAEHLKEYLRRLPDFENDEAEAKALNLAEQHDSFHQALTLLVNWPASDRAANLVLTRSSELDGNHYWLLTPAADALDPRHPLAATLMLRSMITYALENGRTKRYGHAARHLKTCELLARRIEDFGAYASHDAFVAELKLRHGRKSAFWKA